MWKHVWKDESGWSRSRACWAPAAAAQPAGCAWKPGWAAPHGRSAGLHSPAPGALTLLFCPHSSHPSVWLQLLPGSGLPWFPFLAWKYSSVLDLFPFLGLSLTLPRKLCPSWSLGGTPCSNHLLSDRPWLPGPPQHALAAVTGPERSVLRD